MAIDDLLNPVVADKLARFGPGESGKAAQINYSVPLPGAYSCDRIVELEVPSGWFVEGATKPGKSLRELGVVEGDEGHLTRVNKEKLAEFYRQALPATARPALRLVSEIGGIVEPLLPTADMRLPPDHGDDQLLTRRRIFGEPEDVERQRVRIDSYLTRLAEIQSTSTVPVAGTALISLPVKGIGHSIHTVAIDPVAHTVPRIALVETWELRSYLGDYGLGRTLQTFSLLPGERTTITVSTWRTESATREDATSIFDSSDTAAQSRFTSSLASESGAAFQDQGGWSTSVSTSVGGGFNFGIVSGSAKVEAGFAANHQESSQQWSSALSQSASEHAAQVNNSRRQSVESTSVTTTTSGTTTTTMRDLANTNLRRVLNFVFRELNQTYETYTVLRDLKVAFYNGKPGSLEIVALPDVGRLIRRYVQPKHQEEMARFVLTMCAQRIDANNDLVTTLQIGTQPSGVGYSWQPAALEAEGTLKFAGDLLASDVRWRFAQGPLSKDERAVNGVVMNRSNVVLRTDNMVVEALLGQADALDPYASALQALDLLRRQADTQALDIETERLVDALALVEAQDDDEKVEAWQKIFPDRPEIQVVPVVSVSSNGGHQP